MKNFYYLILAFILVNCSANDTDENRQVTPFEPGFYLSTSYILDTGVDLNGDGIFNNDLFNEEVMFCFGGTNFDENQTVINPVHITSISIFVTDDNIQDYTCPNFDGFRPNYRQIEDTIEFYFTENTLFQGSEERILFTGILSENNRFLTLDLDYEETLFPSLSSNFGPQNILNQDGSIQEYLGGIKIVFERQE